MTSGLEGWLTGPGGGSAALALVAAFLLGLRHATDPDHLAAVSTLVLSREAGERTAPSTLGLAWGVGHGLTVLLLGLPVLFVGSYLPDAVRVGAEAAVGLLIGALAARLLWRWHRGYLHGHPHRHGDVLHVHPHLHEKGRPEDEPVRHLRVVGPAKDGAASHGHVHGSLGRSPLESFGIGLVHGVGGSAGAGVLLVVSARDARHGLVALLLFALGTVLSMTALTALTGRLLTRRAVADRLEAALPVFGGLTLAFGLWYAVEALGLLSP